MPFYTVPALAGISALPHEFITDTALAPVATGEPTVAEVRAYGVANNLAGVIVGYNGTDTDTAGTETHVFHIDVDSEVLLLQGPGGDGVNVSAWASTSAYNMGDVVVTPTGALVRASAPHTSNTAFNVTESAKWSVIGTTASITDYAANNYYYAGQQITDTSHTLECLAGHVSGATFDAAEAANWKLISQGIVPVFAAATVYVTGAAITDNEIIYKRNATGVSGASFDVAEQANWTAITGASEAPIVTQLKRWTEGNSAPAVVEGSGLGHVYAQLEDNDVAATQFYRIDENAATNTDQYVKIRYLRDAADLQGKILRMDTGVIVNSASVSFDVNSTTTTVSKLGVGIEPEVVSSHIDDATITHIIRFSTFPGASGWRINPGSAAPGDTTGVGTLKIVDLDLNYAYSPGGLETVRVDASAAAQAIMLPAATGSNDAILYTLVDKTNAATITVQAGENLNNALDDVFDFAQYEEGAQFLATDRAIGEWDLSPIGSTGNVSSRVGEFFFSKSGSTVEGVLPVSPGTVVNGAVVYPNWAAMYPEFVSGNDIVFPANVSGMFLRNIGSNGQVQAAAEGAFQNYQNAYHRHGLGSDGVTRWRPTSGTSNTNGGDGQAPRLTVTDWHGNASRQESNPANRAFQLYTIVDTYNEMAMLGMVPVSSLATGFINRPYYTADIISNTTTAQYVPLAVADVELTENITHDEPNDQFVIVNDGRYEIVAQFGAFGNAGEYETQGEIHVNGISVAARRSRDSVDDHDLADILWVGNLSSGDTVKFWWEPGQNNADLISFTAKVEQKPGRTVETTTVNTQAVHQWKRTVTPQPVVKDDYWVVEAGHTVNLPPGSADGDSVNFAPANGDWNLLGATFQTSDTATIGAGQTGVPAEADVVTMIFDAVADNWLVVM